MSTDSADMGGTASAIGGTENSVFCVGGEISGCAVTMLFRAIDSDSAIRQAHARGMRVDTCKLTQERN